MNEVVQLEQLSSAQREAVEATEGIIRVIASAGSGKTRALSMRFAWLVLELGILPSSILCVTFTNKSAAEMRRRIHALTLDEDTGMITTFHGLCNMILLEESSAIHFPKSFMVLDNADIDEFLNIVYEEKGLSSRDMTFSKARDMIEMKKLREYPEYKLDLIHLSIQDLQRKYDQAKEADDMIFFGYLLQQKKNFALDYNDLILLTLLIFAENPDIAYKWQSRMEYIMIDEFQDIDELQVELMEVLAGVHHNLFVVGDPDQTIYTWRGARVEFLKNFDQTHPGCRTIFLNENYRSTPQILHTANMLIAHNANRVKKDMVPVLPDGAAVHGGHFQNAPDEARAIVEHIQHLLHKGYRYQDMAILYRAHYMSRPIEDVFLEAKIPYVLYSGVPFFQRKEIKDVLGYLRMLVYKDDLDFLRTINTPKRNIGKTRIAFLKQEAAEKGISLYEALQQNLETERFASTKAAEYVTLIENTAWKQMPVSAVLAEILEHSGYEKMLRLEGAQERLDNLAELRQAASEYEISWGEETTLESFLSYAALASAADGAQSQDKVKMMTIHTAKGLEFDCVFLPGFNEGMFPTRKTKSLASMEEERRLAFVAITRAKKELYFSEAEGMLHGSFGRYPSRFLLEASPAIGNWDPPIPQDLAAISQRMIQRRPSLQSGASPNALQSGNRVVHAVFGTGTILSVDEEAQSLVIQFDKLNTARTLSMRVKLKKEEGDGRQKFVC